MSIALFFVNAENYLKNKKKKKEKKKKVATFDDLQEMLPRISSVRMQGVHFCVVNQFERTEIECIKKH